MTANYKATVNVQATENDLRSNQDWITGVFAAMSAKVDAHMILTWATWDSTGVTGLYTVTFRYVAGQDTEAVTIIHDAAVAAGVAYDAVRVTCGGRTLDGPTLLAAAR